MIKCLIFEPNDVFISLIELTLNKNSFFIHEIERRKIYEEVS